MRELLTKAKTLVVEFDAGHLNDVGDSTVEDFAAAIPSDFLTAEFPNKQVLIRREALLPFLHELAQMGHREDGIVFQR